MNETAFAESVRMHRAGFHAGSPEPASACSEFLTDDDDEQCVDGPVEMLVWLMFSVAVVGSVAAIVFG